MQILIFVPLLSPHTPLTREKEEKSMMRYPLPFFILPHFPQNIQPPFGTEKTQRIKRSLFSLFLLSSGKKRKEEENPLLSLFSLLIPSAPRHPKNAHFSRVWEVLREKREEEAFSDNERKWKGRGWRFWWVRMWTRVVFGNEDRLGEEGKEEVGFFFEIRREERKEEDLEDVTLQDPLFGSFLLVFGFRLTEN